MRRDLRSAWLLPLVLGLAPALTAAARLAARRSHDHHGAATMRRGHAAPAPTDPAKDAALIVDGETGKVLYARNADAERHPASLTKMMTLYLLFDALKKGQVNLAHAICRFPQHAATQKPTKLHLRAGDTIPVDIAIKAIVVRSANDVAVAIAEGSGRHRIAFRRDDDREGARARHAQHVLSQRLGPARRRCRSRRPAISAILARHLAYDFPQYFPYFATARLQLSRRRPISTHDNLIGRYQGADGIKTGYTGASGLQSRVFGRARRKTTSSAW